MLTIKKQYLNFIFMNSIVDVLFRVVFFNIADLFGCGKSANLPLALAILLFGYVYVTIRLKGLQFTRFHTMIKYVFNSNDNNVKKGTSSSIKTLLTSIASCTGMNATAGIVFMVAVGGVGTIFWLPILALLSMPFRFAEVWLSHSYRSIRKNNSMLGGPFDYIKKGLADLGFVKIGKGLALFYAVAMVVTGAIGLSMYEMNQSVVIFEKSFSFLEGKRALLSAFFTLVAVWAILGGTKRIATFMTISLPTLSLIYVLVSFVVIVANYAKLGTALAIIFNDALHPRSIAGGFIGSFCMCARKCALSHETGLGTSGIVHALSSETDSVKEAIRSMMTPLINGLIICMATALVLVTTETYQDVDIMKDGVPALSYAFGSVCKMFSYVVIVIIPLFTINVMIGWSNYVGKCSQYICGNKPFTVITMVVFFVFAFVGGIIDDFVLIMNTIDVLLMFILMVNVPVVVILSGKVAMSLKKYKF